MSRVFEGKARQTTLRVARRAMLQGRSIVNLTEDVRKYAADLDVGFEVPLTRRNPSRL